MFACPRWGCPRSVRRQLCTRKYLLRSTRLWSAWVHTCRCGRRPDCTGHSALRDLRTSCMPGTICTLRTSYSLRFRQGHNWRTSLEQCCKLGTFLGAVRVDKPYTSSARRRCTRCNRMVGCHSCSSIPHTSRNCSVPGRYCRSNSSKVGYHTWCTPSLAPCLHGRSDRKSIEGSPHGEAESLSRPG
jgi:hypothetical protein